MLLLLDVNSMEYHCKNDGSNKSDKIWNFDWSVRHAKQTSYHIEELFAVKLLHEQGGLSLNFKLLYELKMQIIGSALSFANKLLCMNSK